jgi:ActR/RegA family two-component response regulator
MDTATSTSPATTRALPPQRILLVDDDEDYAFFLRREIVRTRRPATVHVVHDEASAHRALASGSYDLVLTDFDLKGGNGLRVCEAARVRHPAARRVLVTGAPERVPAASHQAQVVWDKKWETRTIRQALSNVLTPAP